MNRNLLGCCGIYCGACFAYRGRVSEGAAELRNELKKEKFRRIATAFDWVGDWRQFSRWLYWLMKFKCEGCQTGGGWPWCPVRRCCKKKGFTSCAECEEMPCEKLGWITKRYKGWNLKNLRRIREVGVGRWLKEADAEVRRGFVAGETIAGIKRTKRAS